MKCEIDFILGNERIRITEDNQVLITKKGSFLGDFFINDKKLKLIKRILNPYINKTDPINSIEFDGKKGFTKAKAYIIKDIIYDVCFCDVLESKREDQKYIKKLEEAYQVKLNEEIKKIASFSYSGFALKKPLLMELVGYERMIDKQDDFIPLLIISYNNIVSFDVKAEDFVIRDLTNNNILSRSKDIKELFEVKINTKNSFKSLSIGIENAFDNTFKSYNAFHKMIVKHTPLFKINSDQSIEEKPMVRFYEEEIQLNGIVKIGSMQAEITEIRPKIIKVRLIRGTKTLLDGEELTNGQELTIRVGKAYSFSLDSKAGKEEWEVVFKKQNFEPEIRELEFNKILQIIGVDGVNTLEDFETYKSLMMFLDIIMKRKDNDTLLEFYRLLDEDQDIYEEFITKYLIDYSDDKLDEIEDFKDKKSIKEKLLFISTFANYNYLYYPRYLFGQVKYFQNDLFLKDFLYKLNCSVKDEFIPNYFIKLFDSLGLYQDLDDKEGESLNKTFMFLGQIFRENPDDFEDIKYHIEKETFRTESEEEINYAVSKLISIILKDDEILEKAQELYSKGRLRVPVAFMEVK